MQTLSTDDGSAEAVRKAAEKALVQNESRLALERELDRLNVAVQGSAAALSQHLSWMLVSQAFLLTAFMIVLVGGWNVPLPGKHWLLIGISAFAITTVVATYLGLRAARDRVGPLKQHRQRVEHALERVAARPPAFARQGAITAALAQLSTRGLPLLACSGWVALVFYTLAMPMPADVRTAAVKSEQRAKNLIPAAPPKATRSGVAATKGAPAPATEPATVEAEEGAGTASPLVDFLRRAVNTPPAVESQEPIKP